MNIDNLIKYLPADIINAPQQALTMFEVKKEEIADLCQGLHKDCGLPLKLITACDNRSTSGDFKIFYIFHVPEKNYFLIPYIKTTDEKFPSIVKKIHEASVFEKKIKTFFGLEPVGHPHSTPIILQENWPTNIYPLRKDFAWDTKVPMANNKENFTIFKGEGIYDIPVGPVHAGIIEPGYFRFSVLGEEILMFQAQLGYVHKGSEKLFETLNLKDKLKLSEKISGDSTFSHSLAFCQAVENLANLEISEQTGYLRVIFSELERLANHFGDIGAMMLDTGFNFGGAQGARLRESIMQINERLTGSRYLRGINNFGGINFNINKDDFTKLAEELLNIKNDFESVIEIAEKSSSLLNRLKKTGILSKRQAVDHGIVGVAARACGIKVDARIDTPYAAYDKLEFKIQTEQDCDVYSRFQVRIKEVRVSFELLNGSLHILLKLETNNHKQSSELKLKPSSYAIGITEGWRGEIIYFVCTDSTGQICRVDVRDPSLLNWTVTPYAVKSNVVPDFPLINKSFNLSYSGNDV